MESAREGRERKSFYAGFSARAPPLCGKASNEYRFN